VVEGSTGNHSSEALDYAGARTLGPDRAHALFEVIPFKEVFRRAKSH
jgi:hypothetical protein